MGYCKGIFIHSYKVYKYIFSVLKGRTIFGHRQEDDMTPTCLGYSKRPHLLAQYYSSY